eukprot:TRINITY_DN19645_c0_g1_i1.p1 TRINITY_DN19645_c0_g1~~TRINITY_DN19645_c0_g1_i1.p1  ORF type:complete len:539 (+),score=136.79 TRINITY_DN19645_c0_g1_i1:96-1619(+)
MPLGRRGQLLCAAQAVVAAALLVLQPSLPWTGSGAQQPAGSPTAPPTSGSGGGGSGAVWPWPPPGPPPAPVLRPAEADLRTASFSDLAAYKAGNRTAMLFDMPFASHERLLAGQALPLAPSPASSLWPCLPPSASDSGGPGVTVWLPWAEGMTQVPVSCPVRCAVETRREQLHAADALVVDLAREWAHDRVVYDWRKNRLGKVLVGWNIENIEGRRRKLSRAYRHRYIGKNWTPEFWEQFDLAVSYPLGSDVPLNYYHWALCRDRETSLAVRRFEQRNLEKKAHRAAAFFSSNCDFTSHWRDAFALQLRQSFPVHGYGRCLRTHGVDGAGCGLQKKGAQKACVYSQYTFALVVENSVSIDYVTEKIYEPLLAGAIPVYLGAPNVENFLPTRTAAILAVDFPSVASLARYLRCLLSRPGDLQEYLSWRDREPFQSWRFFRDAYPPLCAVCMHISDAARRKEPRAWLRRLRATLQGAESRRPKVVPYVFAENRGAQRPLPHCFRVAVGS